MLSITRIQNVQATFTADAVLLDMFGLAEVVSPAHIH